MLTVCWHFPNAACRKATSLCFGQAAQIENYGTSSFFQRPQEQVSFISISSIISMTRMDFSRDVTQELEGRPLKWLPIPWLSPAPPSGCFFVGIFLSASWKLLHTLLSHWRLPSGDCVTPRFGCSLKRYKSFPPHANVSSACDEHVNQNRSCRFCCFLRLIYLFFSDHWKKYSPAMFPGDMANMFAPGTEHVTHNKNHMIDWQCCKWQEDQGSMVSILADGGSFRTFSEKSTSQARLEWYQIGR